MAVKISEVKFQPDTGKKGDFDWVSILLIFLAVGIILGAVYFIFYFQESRLQEMIQKGETVSALIVENHAQTTQAIFLGFYNPKTGKLAFIVIPPRTRLKVDYEDRPAYDIIQNIHVKGGMSVVRKTVEKLTNRKFDYYLAYDLRDVEMLVDLLEGLNVTNPRSLNLIQPAREMFIMVPKGTNLLDGAKVRELLFFRDDSDENIMIEDHRIVLESLLETTEEARSLFGSRRVRNLIMKSINTNFSSKDIPVLLEELGKVNSSRLLFYRMFGKQITIKDQSFITPVENGLWLQDRIASVISFLSNQGPAPIEDEIKIEILNGSNNPGQAQSLRNYFLEYGFNVVHFGNAMRSDYEKTMVIDRIGRPSLAKRIADIINCKEVYTRIDKTLLVDITIIIGNDFEGRYVR